MSAPEPACDKLFDGVGAAERARNIMSAEPAVDATTAQR
jgi:hypothetical protein